MIICAVTTVTPAAGKEGREQNSLSCASEILCHRKQLTSGLIFHSIRKVDDGVTSARGLDVQCLHFLHLKKRDNCFWKSVAKTNGIKVLCRISLCLDDTVERVPDTAQ